MTDNKKLTSFYKLNEKTCKQFLVRLYVTAEAWAKTKGISLEDIEIVNEEMSMNSTNATWKFIKSENAKTEKTSSGLLGPNGLPIELGGYASN